MLFNVENDQTQRTKNALLEAMESLLNQKIFDKITVNDLCEEAGVARSTFYVHYNNKYHLLLNTLKHLIDQSMISSKKLSPKLTLKRFFEFADSNRTLLSNVFIGNIDYELLDVQKKVFSDACETYLLRHERSIYHCSDKNDIMFSFYISGITGVLFQWIYGKYSLDIDELVDVQYDILERLFA